MSGAWAAEQARDTKQRCQQSPRRTPQGGGRKKGFFHQARHNTGFHSKPADFTFFAFLESPPSASLVAGRIPGPALAQPVHRRPHAQCLAVAAFGTVCRRAVVLPQRQQADQGDQADAGQRGELVALAQVGKRLARLRLADPGTQRGREAKVLHQGNKRADRCGPQPADGHQPRIEPATVKPQRDGTQCRKQPRPDIERGACGVGVEPGQDQECGQPPGSQRAVIQGRQKKVKPAGFE